VAKITDIDITSLLFPEGSAPSTPASTKWRLYFKTTGLFYKDDAGVEVGPLTPGVAAGNQVVAAALGYNGPVATNNTTPAASGAYLHPIQINAPMLLRSLDVHMQAASSGTWQWGLFDTSSSATAATKLAGGSGTLNGTGIQVIAATSAPVTVQPGGYYLIVHAPAANQGSVYRVATVATVLAKSQASYAWDDTPDITTGWSTTTNFYQWFLHGDADGSNQW